MTIFLFIMGLIGYILYYCMITYYIKNIISFKSKSMFSHIKALVCIICFLSFSYISQIEDIFVMFGYAILLYVLYKGLYQDVTLKIIYVILFSTLNLYACILFYRGILSLIFDISFTFVTTNFILNVTACVLSMYTNIFAMILVQRYISADEIRIFFSDKDGVLFTTTILFYAFMFCGYNNVNTYIQEYYPFMKILQMKIGIFVFVGTFTFSIFGYILSRFNLFRDKSKKVQLQLHKLKEEEKEYIDIATYCPMTGAYKRNYGITYLKNKIINNNGVFTVTFIDLDGLKIVNDNLGHQAGDLYICSVVNVIKNICNGCMISRYGGDEFLVVMDEKDQYEAEKSLILCCKTVEEMSKSEDIKFNMSISYGYYEVNNKNKLNYEDILETIDNRMYEFKKARKKARQI